MSRSLAAPVVLATAALAALGALGLDAVGSRLAPPRARPLPAETAAGDAGAADAPAASGHHRHEDPRPDILLFTIDTTRADHLSAYGYERPTSPAFDALAARGALFSRAYSTANWTAPSVASLVSGVLPSEHGVLHGRLHEGVFDQETLSPELPSLAETLRDAGYHTVGVTANGHLSAPLGFSRGFDDYTCAGFVDLSEVRGAIDDAIEALEDDPRPFFLWVHLFDPHAPYVPREPFFSTLWPRDRARFPALHTVPFAELLAPSVAADPSGEVLAYLVAAYDSEIRADDDQLGSLVEALDDGHLAVLVTADHGEELADHGNYGHGHTLYEESVHVPMALALPGGGAGRVVDDVVSLLDVAPTLVELAGAPIPEGMRGRSLVPLARGEPMPPRGALLEASRDVVVRGIVEGPLKYAEVLRPLELEVLYDLDADPEEHRDVIGERPGEAAAMRARMVEVLEAAEARRPETRSLTLSDEEVARLRALGYLP